MPSIVGRQVYDFFLVARQMPDQAAPVLQKYMVRHWKNQTDGFPCRATGCSSGNKDLLSRKLKAAMAMLGSQNVNRLISFH